MTATYIVFFLHIASFALRTQNHRTGIGEHDSPVKNFMERDKYIHLYVIVMSHTSFRVDLHSTVCLNVKEFLARSRRHIWSLSDSSGIRTNSHLFHKQTLNGWVFVCKLSGCGFEFRSCHLIFYVYFGITKKTLPAYHK